MDKLPDFASAQSKELLGAWSVLRESVLHQDHEVFTTHLAPVVDAAALDAADAGAALRAVSAGVIGHASARRRGPPSRGSHAPPRGGR